MQQLLGRKSLTIAFKQAGTQRLVSSVSTGAFLPVVLTKFQQDIFFPFYNISHLGRLASRRLVSSRYVWRSFSQEVAAWAKNCLYFQQSKIQCHTKTRPLHIPIA
jgi:hypothetical protein